jgi:arylsulfatase A-like enzyme/Flp pilus assembly protein TadD
MKRLQISQDKKKSYFVKINKKKSISRLNSLWLLLCVCLIVSASFASKNLRSHGGSSPGRTNLLLITIDTLRADRVSCYDSTHLQTPNIDGLAAEGVIFTRAFANTSTTLPSHTNILLGVSPLYHGVHENQYFVVHENFLTLAEHLKAAGYATGAFVGAFPLDRKFGLHQGFDVYDDDFGHRSSTNKQALERRAADVIAKASQWIKTQSSPWFLWIHCYDPHDPYTPPAPYAEKYAQSPYNGEVAYVDEVLGKFMDEMQQGKKLEDTLVIFTGDHGESLWQHGEETHGFFAYNTAIWIPLIVAGPGIKARKVETAVSHLDIFPTVCDVLDLEKPGFLQGRSLVPALRGRRLADQDLYFESLSPHYGMGWAPLRGFIRGKFKFIQSPIPELYDLEKDFDEQDNLASNRDLGEYNKRLSEIIERDSSPETSHYERGPDRESLEKLRALGYISGSVAAEDKKNYDPEDDVKTLLPYLNQVKKAMTLHQNGKTLEGIEILKAIISEREDFAFSYAHLATLYHEGQGKINDALEVLKLGFSSNPTSYEIFFKYVNLLVQAGRNEQAIELGTNARLREMDYDPDIWTNIGAAYQNIGDLDMARQAYEQALRIDKRNPFAFYKLGFLYYSLALKNNDARALGRSLENYKKAIEFDPYYANAYVGLGNAYLQTDNLEGGIYCLEKALEIRPGQGLVIYNLGMAYFLKGDTKRALGYFTLFKKEHAHLLSPKELGELDELIRKCSSDQES